MPTLPKKQLVMLVLCCAANSAWALDGISISGGANLNTSSTELDFFELSTRDSFDAHWFDTSTGALSAYWDAGIARWSLQGHENWVGRLGLAARYEFKSESTWAPYIEYGVGGAYVPHMQVTNTRYFSTHFQFANRVEIGYRFGSQHENELGLQFLHYSNANIKKPNPGADFINLRYTRRF